MTEKTDGLSVAKYATLVGTSRKTIRERIKRGVLDATFDGYQWRIKGDSKETSKDYEKSSGDINEAIFKKANRIFDSAIADYHIRIASAKTLDELSEIQKESSEMGEKKKAFRSPQKANLFPEIELCQEVEAKQFMPRPIRKLDISFNEETQRLDGIPESDMARWRRDFPRIDIERQVRIAEAWLARTGNRKKDYRAFLSRWMRRAFERYMGVKA